MNEHTTKYLNCKLTPEEMNIHGISLAELNLQKSDIEADKKSVVANFAVKIAQLNDDIFKASTIVSDGYEKRDIDCTWHYEWSTEIKTLTRNDTGETVEAKKVTDQDRQGQFFNDIEEGNVKIGAVK